MASHTITYRPLWVHSALVKVVASKVEGLARKVLPSPRLLISVCMLLIGLAIPVFMLLELLPASLLIGFGGLALTAIGGVLAIFNLGDF